MAYVLVRHAFAFKDVAKMSATVLAQNFNSATIGVGFAMDSAFDFVIETRPAATGMELVLRFVQRRIAATADVRAIGVVVGQFTRAGKFGPLVNDYVFFFLTEGIVSGHRYLFFALYDSAKRMPVNCQRVAAGKKLRYVGRMWVL